MDARLFEDEGVEWFAEALAREGYEVLGQDPALRSVRLRATPSDLPWIAAQDAVRWIGPRPAFSLHNDQMRVVVHANEVQQSPYSLTGSGIDIGIWDESAAEIHPDYAPRLTQVDPVGNNSWHATHVTGTMAGDGSASQGAGGSPQQWRGVAPAAKILSYQFNPPTALFTKAKNAIGRGMELSHNSWGRQFDPAATQAGACGCSCLGSYDSLCRDYDALVRGAQGKTVGVIFSAGNDRPRPPACGNPGSDYQTMPPVGTAKNVLTVGAVNSDTLTVFDASSFGPTADGRLKPDLVAPGCSETGLHVNSTSPGGGYGRKCGTSMAAPVVTGAAALVWEQFRTTYAGEPLPSTVKAFLLGTATDLAAGAPDLPGPDFATGWGLVHIQAAVDAVLARAAVEGTMIQGRTRDFVVTVGAGQPDLTATLVWDDREGVENAGVELVNDLDLVVLDPDGTRHFPWTLDPASPAAPAVRMQEDHLNPVEQVRVEGPIQQGPWILRVAGTSVPKGPQAYSLIVVPSPGFAPFGPDAPGPDVSFAPDAPPPAFVWATGSLAQYRLQWSSSPGFGTTKSSGDAWLTGSPFTPPDATWQKILKLGVSNGVVYWRVTGKDLAGAKSTSPLSSFHLDPPVAAVVTAPAEGASFPAGSLPPQFVWDGSGNSSFRFVFSARADLGSPKKTSGNAWLTGSPWTPTASLWKAILALAASGDGHTVFYRIESKDQLGRLVTDATVRTLQTGP